MKETHDKSEERLYCRAILHAKYMYNLFIGTIRSHWNSNQLVSQPEEIFWHLDGS